MVYYRKYRPQILEDLVGQDNVKTSLISALKADKLSHAYLFSGPRGTGKTSTARILAKMVNCVAKSNVPCNKCEVCLSITDGSSLDLIEIDAASNRGIEDIRTLRENIKLSPTKSVKKVYIIDEVHMLTTEAFNALLKTLEEPPAHALFILATTDPQKIPSTILSRVTRLDFKLADTDQIKLTLEKIVKQEKLKIDDEALNLISKIAQGSFRDGVKLLDQLSSLPKVTLDMARQALSSSPDQQVLELLEKISQKDARASLEKLTAILATGVGVKDLTLGLLDNLRQMMLIKSDIKDSASDDLIKLSERWSLSEIIKMIDGLSDSLDQGRYVAIAALPLEVAVVESCLGEVEYQNTKSEATPPTDDVVIPITALPGVGASEDMQKIAEKWTVILETAKSYNFSLEALLRSSKIARAEENMVYLEVPYAFHQRMIETPKSRDLVESILSDVLGRNIHITTILVKPQNREGISNIEVAADDEIVRIASEIFAS